MTLTVDLTATLDARSAHVKEELASKPVVVDKGDSLDPYDLPVTARKWHSVKDAVAVVADLRGSSQLGTDQHAASTASIYEASTGNVVSIFNTFAADFIAIQGDGAFALFWGENRTQRAICAAVTITKMQNDMLAQLTAKWPNSDAVANTGLRVGVAASKLLVKTVGTPRNPNEQEPVWAGRAVNYASKACAAADVGQVVVCGTIWDRIQNNDYLTLSCPCGSGPSDGLWKDVEIDRLPDTNDERFGRRLTSTWCNIHGPEFCQAILDGKKNRTEVTASLHEKVAKSQQPNVLRWKAQQRRINRLNRVNGGIR